MAKVTDVQGYRRKYDNQMDRLESADIDERDRTEIRRFVAHLRTNDPAVESLGTVVGHLNALRLSAERAHEPLVEFERIDDVNALELHLEEVHGLEEGTIRNYKKSLRKFFCWFEDTDFGEEVAIGSPIQREHDPSKNITADELSAMLDACSEFDMSSRDRAMIALLRDTGLRIGAVLSLQLEHLDLDTARGSLEINTEANVKGASGSKPITWSRAYVANWLDDHPRPDDPEAPVIHKDGQRYDPTDPDDDGALALQYAGYRISRVAERAGLDPDRIHAHLFRGTAISEWIIDGIQDPKIEHRADWVPGSDRRRDYQRVTDEEMNDAIYDHYGIDGDDATEEIPYKLDIGSCPVCDLALSGTEVHCPQCGAPVDSARSVAVDDVEDDVREFLVEGEERSQREYVADIAEAIEDDQAFTRALLAELSDRLD